MKKWFKFKLCCSMLICNLEFFCQILFFFWSQAKKFFQFLFFHILSFTSFFCTIPIWLQI